VALSEGGRDGSYYVCVQYRTDRRPFFRLSMPMGAAPRVSVPVGSLDRGFVMTCLSCQSAKQAELTAEMMMHFPGQLDKPGVWIFPKLRVCLECGFSRFTVPETELASVAKAVS